MPASARRSAATTVTRRPDVLVSLLLAATMGAGSAPPTKPTLPVMLPTRVVTGSTETLCTPVWTVVNCADALPQQLVPHRIEPSGLYTVVAHCRPFDGVRVTFKFW